MKKIIILVILFILLNPLVVCSADSNSTYEEPERVSEEKLTQLLSLFKNNLGEGKGDTFYLFGQVLDTDGKPLPNTRMEIWQTDANGNYRHPRDSAEDDLDKNFQYFGSTATDDQGWYIFRTIIPAPYFPRPRHIHFKVKTQNQNLLTSQFYFSKDIVKVNKEGMFRAVGADGEQLLLQLYSYQNKALARGQIYIGNQKKFTPTPSQAEGPFYPVVEVGQYDNDLLESEGL